MSTDIPPSLRTDIETIYRAESRRVFATLIRLGEGLFDRIRSLPTWSLTRSRV